MTCPFSPSVSTLTIGDLATTSLVINATVASVDSAVSGSKIAAGFLLPFSILGLMGMRKTRKRLCAQCMLALFSVIALASLSGCAGCGAVKSVIPQTSTILVSATTSSGAMQSLPLALNIQ